ncbi:MAG: redox-regulated ATPase YchF [Deltaproteobacteria bacterium]|nr:redox-regulated ATPase YchF [Deltaproteobacteria bacterium]MCL5878220.1 redox-regulated ATPase YchF [Deltaproteobacteria bacterium]
MGFSCGIVGLPNVGKSTIFNALTSSKVSAENFPFTTIEPNIGIVDVPDPRIDVLAGIDKSEKKIYTTLKFVDIAGLVKGASKGEGLGNKFLSHIREVDAIAYVVRCFVNKDIIHVEGDVGPARDIGIINMELLLADLDTVDKRLERAAKSAKSGNKKLIEEADFFKRLSAHLSGGKKAITLQANPEEQALLRELNLLTSKPAMYIANVTELNPSGDTAASGTQEQAYVKEVQAEALEEGAGVVVICGKLEAELAELDAAERIDYLKELGIKRSGLDEMIEKGYRLLNLMTFFTSGPKEAHAWTIVKGAKAPQAAGRIHSDFEKGFIKAEVISYEHYVTAGSEAAAREQGFLRIEGKEYVMQEGDIVHFRFNVSGR